MFLAFPDIMITVSESDLMLMVCARLTILAALTLAKEAIVTLSTVDGTGRFSTSVTD